MWAILCLVEEALGQRWNHSVLCVILIRWVTEFQVQPPDGASEEGNKIAGCSRTEAERFGYAANHTRLWNNKNTRTRYKNCTRGETEASGTPYLTVWRSLGFAPRAGAKEKVRWAFLLERFGLHNSYISQGVNGKCMRSAAVAGLWRWEEGCGPDIRSQSSLIKHLLGRQNN